MWVSDRMHVGMCLTKWSLCFPKGGVSGSSTASTQWQKQHVTFSNRETDPLASPKGKQAKSPLGHGTLHLPLPLLYPPYLNNFVSGLFLRKMRFLPLIWGNILSKIAVFLNSAFYDVFGWMLNGEWLNAQLLRDVIFLCTSISTEPCHPLNEQHARPLSSGFRDRVHIRYQRPFHHQLISSSFTSFITCLSWWEKKISLPSYCPPYILPKPQTLLEG